MKVSRGILARLTPCGGAFLVGTLETHTACAGKVFLARDYPMVSFSCQRHWPNPATPV